MTNNTAHGIANVVSQHLVNGVWYAEPPRVTVHCYCGATSRSRRGTSAAFQAHAKHVQRALRKSEPTTTPTTR